MKPTRITIDVWPDGRVDVISKVSEETNLPTIVTLDKSDPDFDRKRKDLKAKGYRWSKRHNHWRLPSTTVATASTSFENWWGEEKEVKLLKTATDFEAKKAALKAAGATYDGIDNLWVLPQ